MTYDFFLSGLTERRQHQVIEAINIINQAKEKNVIRNVIFNDVKDTINRACYESSSALKPPYKKTYRSYALQQFHDNVHIWTLHDVISVNKKVQKMKETDEMVEFYAKMCNELLELALTVKDLKSKVIKGRAPSEEPAKPVNPNKIIRQCGCCLRQIAIGKDKTMVHHGFERPGDGYQTESCPGIDFKPLEMSKDGPIYMIKLITSRIEYQKSVLKNLKTCTTINYVNYKNQTVTLSEGDTKFKSEKEYQISNITSMIKSLQRQLRDFNKIVDEWVQKEAF